MNVWQNIGWAAWALLVLSAIGWSIQCYVYIKRGAGVTYGTLNTTILRWFLLGWTFHYESVNKLHLLWLAPSAILIASFVAIPQAISSMGEKKIVPPGLLLLGGYGLVFHVVAHQHSLVGGQAVQNQMHGLSATMHHLLEQFDEQFAVERAFIHAKPECPCAVTAEAALIDWR